jgi:ribosomal-protein-alanine N-acetyltransferase
MRHLGTQLIETERLTLRRLLPEDAAQMYHNWARDPQVTRYLRWQPHTSADDTLQLLRLWEPLYQNADYYQWAIVEKSTQIVFGSISLFDNRTQEKCDPAMWKTPGLDFSQGEWEPGYCIGRDWWGKGYATEALRAVVNFWFRDVGGSWLACSHAAKNPASGHVMKKVGFKMDHGAFYHKFYGIPVLCKVYCLTKEAFEQVDALAVQPSVIG